MSTACVKLAVIIVSYRNADDIDRCLKSLARSDWDQFEIFICENGGEAAYEKLLAALVGSDRTLQRITDGSGALDQPQKRLTSVAKCQFHDRENIVRIGLAIENLGYGGGVNTWLESLLGVPDWDSVLVLNPDTEVDRRSLSELVAKSVEGFSMVGGSLVFHDTPDKIISYGLHWSPVTGRVVAVGRNAPVGSAPSVEDANRIDAVSGACVLVTRAFVEDVGLMAEDYFLYMEDLDWGRRRGKHLIGFASKAIVRHIGGTTIGSAVDPGKRSSLSIYLSARNCILYARRFAGWRWPLHFAVGMAFAIRYLVKGFPYSARTALAGLMDGIKGKSGRPDFSPSL
jgi:N-acetylglucosaminyl-diphospho-decaprenol L-rhamnosyltransferase